MEDLIIDGKTIEFISTKGKVISSDKYSETHIESSGGGGFVSNGSGYVAAPSIKSSSTLHHEFWMKTDEGVEKSIKIYDRDIPIRVGQNITMIAAKVKGGEKNINCILVNHSAEKHWFVVSRIKFLQSLDLYLLKNSIFYMPILIMLGIPFLGGWAEESWAIALLSLAIFFIYRIVVHAKKWTRIEKKLAAHLERVAQHAYN